MSNAYQILSGFSYGELDPKLAARVDFTAYTRGVKTAENVVSIPQGGFSRRFGTKYIATLGSTNWEYVRTFGLIYDNEAVYLLVFEDLSIDIYLEGTLLATVVTTYPAEIIRELYFVVVNNRLIILHQNHAPAQLVRSAVAANAITGVDTANDYITITNALTVGNIYPATFTTAGALPVSDPQILVNTLYYIRPITATSIRVYNTPEDASNNENWFDITATGVGNLILQNTWTLSNIPFSNLPAYDFDFFPTYSAAGFTFQASAVTGTLAAPVTLTASGNVFTAAMVGGLFIGNGGVMRITAYTNAQNVDGITYEDFNNNGTFPGREGFLGEPAWSATRGYPSCGAFYQERLFLGGSRSIPNGVWGSTTFAVYDFDDSQSLDDSAISYYSSAGQSNVVKAMSSAKSLIVHTNTGNYSTALTLETPITPSTFTLTEQNKDGVSSVIPEYVDNQLVYIDRSSNNVKTMAWDIVQSSFVNTNISLPSSHLVDTPIDMDVYREPNFTDGYYIMFMNSDGTMAIYNSLVEQDVRGWTKAVTGQNQTVSNLITGVDTGNDYITITDALTVGTVYSATFTTTGTLPASNPQIYTTQTYYIRPITATNIRVYWNWNDASNNVNFFDITANGTGVNNVVLANENATAYFRDMASGLNKGWVVVERSINGTDALYIEELDFTVRTDSSVKYDFATATATLTGLNHLEGEVVQVFADGVVMPDETVSGGSITLDSTVSEAFVGLKYTSTITPLPINIPTQAGPTLYQAAKIRRLQIHYFESIGVKIQGYNIPTLELQDLVLDSVATPKTGVYEYTLMEGWDAFNYSIDIIQEYPLPFTLLAIGYNVEV